MRGSNEVERLAALARYRILDTAPEPLFDYLVHTAASALRTPMAFITLVDGERRWVKARVGLPMRGSPRKATFADWAILSDEVMVVDDALQDPRFCSLPIVTGAVKARFYAGAPLISADGHRVGVLAVVAPEPRKGLCDAEHATLRSLAAAVVSAMEMRIEMAERREVERRLKVQNELLEMTEVVANIGHWREDFVEGTVERSSQLHAIHGVDPSIHDWDARIEPFAEEDRPRIARLVEEAAVNRQPISFDARLLRRADGEMRHVHVRSHLQYDEAGEPVGRFGVLQDVTEHRRALDAAQSASRAKADFLANMSHEIRTPLTSIIGFAGLLKNRNDVPEGPRALADRIHTASEGLLSVVNDVLDFSKLEAHEIQLEEQPLALAELARSALETISVMANAKGLTLRIEDELGGRDRAVGDQGRLRQILLNLLSNAVKFTAAGSVTLRLEAHGPGVRISVRDTGCGIPEQYQGRLFQRFAQADETTARRYGGSGLGLAICRELVGLMGGAIDFESQAGAGSTFRVTLPFELSASQPAAQAEAGDDALSLGGRVLVVDDVDFNRELVRLLLEPIGLEVSEAASGCEAMTVCNDAAFDLIIMDINMPGMDGLATTAAVRASCPLNAHTPIIAFTASAEREKTDQYLQAGMDDCLTKPVRPAEFYARIAHWLTAQPAPPVAKAHAGLH